MQLPQVIRCESGLVISMIDGYEAHCCTEPGDVEIYLGKKIEGSDKMIPIINDIYIVAGKDIEAELAKLRAMTAADVLALEAKSKEEAENDKFAQEPPDCSQCRRTAEPVKVQSVQLDFLNGLGAVLMPELEYGTSVILLFKVDREWRMSISYRHHWLELHGLEVIEQLTAISKMTVKEAREEEAVYAAYWGVPNPATPTSE